MDTYPYHADGTDFYWAEDGTLMLDCPNCGVRQIPSCKVRYFRHLAGPQPIGKSGPSRMHNAKPMMVERPPGNS